MKRFQAPLRKPRVIVKDAYELMAAVKKRKRILTLNAANSKIAKLPKKEQAMVIEKEFGG